ncbi:MAG: hypothetical protein QW275_00850 [Candidatus Anstonellaceae archaeon]
MFLPQEEKKQIPYISAIFAASFSILLVLGCASMVFANFQLGAILFSLGLVLVAGNEYMLFQRQIYRKDIRQHSLSSDIEQLLVFSILAFFAGGAIAYLHYLVYGWSEKMLIAIACGFLSSIVKISSVTAQLLLIKK